jgi:diguanylate cyclase
MPTTIDRAHERYAAQLVVESHRQVLLYSALITLLATAVPLGVVSIVLSQIADVPDDAFIGVLTIAGAIPLIITPPIAYFAMTLFRLVTLTIKRVDDHVRFDAMTGLFNRDHFLDQVRACQTGGTVLIVDVDHFKLVNDRYGHDAGDAALTMVAQLIADVISSCGIAGRLGGEEFGVYLPSWTIEQATIAADAICAHVRTHRDTSTGHDLRLTLSIGGAEHRANTMIRDALKIADERLYLAKSGGRDRYVLTNLVGRLPAQAA